MLAHLIKAFGALLLLFVCDSWGKIAVMQGHFCTIPTPPSPLFPFRWKKNYLLSLHSSTSHTFNLFPLFWRPFLLLGRTTETCFVHIAECFFPWLVAFSVLFPTWLCSVVFNKCLEKKCSLVPSSICSSTGSGLEDFLTGSLSPSRSHAQRGQLGFVERLLFIWVSLLLCLNILAANLLFCGFPIMTTAVNCLVGGMDVL